MTTSVRVALLYVLLSLGSSLALVGFIHLQTRDDALAELKSNVEDEADTFVELQGNDDPGAIRSAIAAALASRDSRLVIGVFDASGQRLGGNIARLPGDLGEPGYEVTTVTMASGKPVEAGISTRRLKDGGYLISGRSFDEKLSLQRTLRQALLFSAILSLVLGLIGSLVLTRYVSRRISRISRVVDQVGQGHLERRVPVSGTADAFDGLSMRINVMLDRIQSLMDELRLLTDSLAHDLRSPVSRLRSRIERALTVTDEEQRDLALNGVMQETDALMRMLTTVLEIGRSEAMASRQQFEPLDPARLMADLADMYGPLAEEAGTQLTLDLPEMPVLISGHRQLLAQALSNLVDNAFKYGASGRLVGLAVEIGTSATVHLSVADHGIGIAPEDETEARRRFGRLDRARSSEGAGLGLALVDAVARLHGGTLTLGDNGPGLRATVTLPLLQA